MRIISLYIFFLSFIFCCKSDCIRPERCKMTPEIDPCYAAIPRYYYDSEENKCKEYTWGGCTEFPFETIEECEACECSD